MNYGTTTYIYGQTKLPLKYEDTKLNEMIGNFISVSKEFTYSQLCNYILTIAEQEGMLEKQPNTSYSQILLTPNDTIKINKFLWERIWAKEILILFSSPQDMYHRSDETYFIVNK